MIERADVGSIPSACLFELVFDNILVGARLQIHIPHEQGYLVVRIQRGPHLLRQRHGVRGIQSDPLRFTLKRGEGVAVAHVGVDEAALTS